MKTHRLRLVCGLALIALLTAGPSSTADLGALPEPELEGLELSVRDQIGAARQLLASLPPDGAPSERALAVGELGRLYHAYRFDEAALACYERAESLAPDTPAWPHHRGLVLEPLGRLEEAETAFRRVLKLTPGNLPVRVRLGRVLLARGELAAAREELEQVLAAQPANAAARATLGQIALSERNHREAVDHLQAALTAVPDATRLHYPLALAYRGLGDLEKAREHLAQRGEIGVSPRDSVAESLNHLRAGEVAHLLRGRSAFQAGQYAVAAEEFQSAVEAQPESARARINLAAALAQIGKVEPAMAELEVAARLAPDNATVHYNLGLLHLRSGDDRAAADALGNAVRLAPDDAAAQRELAQILARLGESAEASEHYRQANALDPANVEARHAEALLLVRSSQWATAIERLESAHRDHPSDGGVAHSLARLLAACPDPQHRDAPRALGLAKLVFEARATAFHAETVALALAEGGDCEAAAEWQQRAFELATQAEDPEAPAYRGQRERMLAGPPCRPPTGTP